MLLNLIWSHLDWTAAILLLIGVEGLRRRKRWGWLFSAASCAVSIVLFYYAAWDGRPIWGKVFQSTALLGWNIWAWRTWRK